MKKHCYHIDKTLTRTIRDKALRPTNPEYRPDALLIHENLWEILKQENGKDRSIIKWDPVMTDPSAQISKPQFLGLDVIVISDGFEWLNKYALVKTVCT